MFCVTTALAPNERSDDAIHRAPARTSVSDAPLPMSTSYELDAENAPLPCHLASPPARHPLVRNATPAVLDSAYFRYAPRTAKVKGDARGAQSTVACSSSKPTGENAP